MIYSYVLYLIGVNDYKVDKTIMRQAIAEFFFMAALTGRYTNSSETRFESDLGTIKGLTDPSDFLAKLGDITATALTRDYWTITLPSDLASSASQSPSLFAYQAALIKLDAKILYSPLPISSMVDPAIKGTKAAFEQHHLFPRAHLADIGVTDLRLVNQIANFAPVEWSDNIKIGKKVPSDYVPALDAVLDAKQREKLYFWHALPPLWWELPYPEFLIQRRVRMASVIRAAWEQLRGNAPTPSPPTLSVAELISGGESDAVEFKSTLRTNLHTGLQDEKIVQSALKTVAGFLNAAGGTLLIGVADSGVALGLEADGFASEDKFGLHLNDLIKSRIGEVFGPYIHPHFEDLEGKRIVVIRCDKGPKAAFLKCGNDQLFFVRSSNATTELKGASITEFINQRFK